MSCFSVARFNLTVDTPVRIENELKKKGETASGSREKLMKYRANHHNHGRHAVQGENLKKYMPGSKTLELSYSIHSESLLQHQLCAYEVSNQRAYNGSHAFITTRNHLASSISYSKSFCIVM